MKYILIVFILLPSLYTFNYASYSWQNNNKPAAVGSVLLAVISIALPAVLMFIR